MTFGPGHWLVRTIVRAHASLLRLAWTIVPSDLRVVDTAFGAGKAYMVRTFIRLGLAERLSQGPATAKALASELHLDEDALHRFLRGCTWLDLVCLTREGQFSLRPTGRILRRDHPRAAWAFVEYFTSPANLQAWADLDETIRTGGSSFSRTHGVHVWSHLDRHPGDCHYFTEAMAGQTTADAPVIADAYPFDRFTRLCDVGGGRGAVMEELLGRHRSLQAVIQDSEPVVQRARAALERRGLGDRVAFFTESFFARVAPGCDGYLLKNVLHDWDDARCLTILRNVRAAAPPGARVLVVEGAQERNQPGPLSLSDLQMLVVCEGGRERSGAELVRLLEAAGLRYIGTHQTAGLLTIWESLVPDAGALLNSF